MLTSTNIPQVELRTKGMFDGLQTQHHANQSQKCTDRCWNWSWNEIHQWVQNIKIHQDIHFGVIQQLINGEDELSTPLHAYQSREAATTSKQLVFVKLFVSLALKRWNLSNKTVCAQFKQVYANIEWLDATTPFHISRGSSKPACHLHEVTLYPTSSYPSEPSIAR